MAEDHGMDPPTSEEVEEAVEVISAVATICSEVVTIITTEVEIVGSIDFLMYCSAQLSRQFHNVSYTCLAQRANVDCGSTQIEQKRNRADQQR